MKEVTAASAVARFRYLGHRQDGTVRELSFGDMGRDGFENMLHLQIDIALLAKHHLRIQDAPDICLRILAERWTGRPAEPGSPAVISISEVDLARLGDEQEEKIAHKRARRTRHHSSQGAV